LLLLVERRGEVVSREELKDRLWPAGTFVDSDDGLNTAIKKLREVLRDSSERPRYIETIPRRGYRFIGELEVDESDVPELRVETFEGLLPPAEAAPIGDAETKSSRNGRASGTYAYSQQPITDATGVSPRPAEALGRAGTSLWRWLSGAAVLAVGLATAIWYLRRPLPPPRISDSVQITHDGHPKDLTGTDGSRLYLRFWFAGQQTILQVGITGGEIVPFPVTLPNPRLYDVSQDGSSLLVGSEENGQQSLWDLQVPGGTVRHIANGGILYAAWSPDGRSMVYSTPANEIFMARRDGTDLRKLRAAKGHNSRTGHFSWSPDGAIIRFNSGGRIWEMSPDGSGLHEVLPGWRPSSMVSGSRWTPDGKFFLFLVSENPPGGEMWALDERRTGARQKASDPVRLASGPIRWGYPFPGRDGKKIFASGFLLRGEMVRYDAPTRELKPWLGGISAEHLSYSPDGKSIVYVTYPEGILWRANRDGSNLIQLTSPPFYPRNPRWSPDGSKILFCSGQYFRKSQVFIMSSLGGTPQPILPDDREPQNDPTWSPDGQKIVFASGGQNGSELVLQILDLASHQIVTLPGSQGMWSPRWSADGRLIAGINQSGGCSIFDFDSRRWSELQKGECDFPTFSSNGRFVYFIGGNQDGVYRIGVSGGRVERVVDLKGFHHVGVAGLWMGLDPTDTPMLIRDTSSADIYALTLEEK
jgi:Tol biopolymer transport system component